MAKEKLKKLFSEILEIAGKLPCEQEEKENSLLPQSREICFLWTPSLEPVPFGHDFDLVA